MLKNYLKVAFRSIIRQKTHTIINVSGLAIGMACCILISLWVREQLSYDQFHENKNQIFRVNTVTEEYGLVTSSSWRLGPALKELYPEIEDFTRIWPWSRSLVKYEDKKFDEPNFYLADPAFFTIFSFPFIKGTPATALAHKNSIVLTAETAKRYFGEEDPLGKLIHVRLYDSNFEVTGIIENIPKNSSLQFDLLARVDLMPQQRLQSWEFTGFTAVMLHKDSNDKAVNQKIADFYRTHVEPESNYQPVLQPLTKVHLYWSGEPGIIKQVYVFSTVSVFVLLLACINFMNLSTASASRRAREVGIRKVTGAQKNQLVFQFISESMIISFLALLLALGIVELILPFFNDIAGAQLTLLSGQTTTTLVLLPGVAFLTGIVAGSYPAFLLSSFKPARILRGSLFRGKGTATSRRILTIFQFTISVGLIICTLVVRSQLSLIQDIELGLDREFVLTLPNNLDLNKNFESYKSALLEISHIENVTASAALPTDVGNYIEVNWEGHLEQDQVAMAYTMVDYDFFRTFDMKLVQGRAFSREYATDEAQACIINETAADLMGLESPVGKQVYFDHPAFEEPFKHVRIIGVVNDFHFRSLHESIGPFIFRVYRPWHSFVYLRIKPQNLNNTIGDIRKITEKFAPEYPFNYWFLDDSYDRLYQSELRTGKIFDAFASLAILISCLGLLGLASYTVEQRTKEIGVRKVLGASVTRILIMLSKEFTKWVLLANIIAWPLAWIAMNSWLENFAYRMEIGWWIFALAGGIALVIALITVSTKAVKAALANPVDALRYE